MYVYIRIKTSICISAFFGNTFKNLFLCQFLIENLFFGSCFEANCLILYSILLSSIEVQTKNRQIFKSSSNRHKFFFAFFELFLNVGVLIQKSVPILAFIFL